MRTMAALLALAAAAAPASGLLPAGPLPRVLRAAAACLAAPMPPRGQERDATWLPGAERESLEAALADACAAPSEALRWQQASPSPVRVPLAGAPLERLSVSLVCLPPAAYSTELALGGLANPLSSRLAAAPPGSIVFLRQLVGAASVTSYVSPTGRAFGPPRELAGGAVTRLHGGPARFLSSAAEAPSVLLEVVLRPDGWPSNTYGATDGAAECGATTALHRPPEAVAAAMLQTQAQADALAEAEAGPAATAPRSTYTELAVGGLEAELQTIVRRVFASRALNPDGQHVRGLLLYGPPGCGKTLLARELASVVSPDRPAKIVAGPEIMDKWVGSSERAVRELFGDAMAEQEAVDSYNKANGAGSKKRSALHCVIIDELDAVASARGANGGDTSGARDSTVNQLLAMLDGVKEVNNILVIGMTNRKDKLDAALLRPGRLEVHLEIGRPDEAARQQIAAIHAAPLRARMAPDAAAFVDGGALAARTDGYTGADLAGLVRSATSFALARAVPLESLVLFGDGSGGGGGEDAFERIRIVASDFERALAEVRPAPRVTARTRDSSDEDVLRACCGQATPLVADILRGAEAPAAALAALRDVVVPEDLAGDVLRSLSDAELAVGYLEPRLAAAGYEPAAGERGASVGVRLARAAALCRR